MPRDRTYEFNDAVRTFQGRQIMRATSIKDIKKVKMLQSYGEFMMAAKSIGKNIASTYAKLEKLTLLVKRKPLFDDKPTEIQELTYIIKEDLKDINEHLARLQGISKNQAVIHQKSHKHLLSHSNSVVISLQSKLANMSNEFKQVLDTRTQNLKQAKDRRDQFSEAVASTSSVTSVSTLPFRQENKSLFFTSHQMVEMNDMNAYQTESKPLDMQTQLLMKPENTNQYQLQYLQDRADTMQNIESTIIELGGIFQQLAYMVKEQDEMVERIDTNVLQAEMNVEAAHHQILKYFQSVTSNRSLMLKIFAVIMFFFTFFAVFIA